MLHLYFFTSSKQNDVVRNITVMSRSIRRAYSAAHKYFINNQAEGKPMLLAI